MHYLYKITNELNGKIYIGQTINYGNRWLAHKAYAKNPERTGQYIHHAMAKYGVDNFIYEIIATCRTQENANETESLLIVQYNSRNKDFGYNVKPGGNTSPHSEETKQKLREATLKQIETQGHPAQGLKWNGEQKAKLSASLKAIDKEKWYTPEVRKNMSDAHIGKKQPEELVKKCAETIRNNKGEMICDVPGCGIIEDRGHAPVINGIRYCAAHAWRLTKTGTVDLLPRKAHNRKEFTSEQIDNILLDKRAAKTIGKDYDVSERVILRIRKEFKK